MPVVDPYAPKKKNIPLKKLKIIINRCYDKSMSTKDIKDDFGFISFTREFTYLRSMISYLRIKKSYQAMVFFNFFGIQNMSI